MSDAMRIADESDLPAIIRCLLTNVSRATARSMVDTVRHQSATVTPHVLSLVTEVVLSALRTHTFAVRAYLNAVGSARTLYPIDVLVLCSFMHASRLSDSVWTTVLQCLQSRTLTLALVEDVLSSAPMAPVLQPMAPALMTFARRLVKHLSGGTPVTTSQRTARMKTDHTTASFTAAAQHDVTSTWIIELHCLLFAYLPSCRMEVMRFIVASCAVEQIDEPLVGPSRGSDENDFPPGVQSALADCACEVLRRLSQHAGHHLLPVRSLA